MQKFLLKIQDKEKIELLQLLAKHLGVDMIPFSENGQEETQELVEETSSKKYYEVKDHYTQEDILDIVAQFPEDKKWTFSDLENESIFPNDLMVKTHLIDNKLYIMPNPSPKHQKILNRTSTYMTLFVDENELGEMYVAPVSVKIDENTALEPDIIYISVAKLESVTMRAIEAAPELVVEVISPANYKKLREEKKAKYAEFGVEEYWEIYPKKKLVRIETLTENKDTNEKEYELFSEATETGKVKSKVLEGFSLDIEKVFK